MDLQIS
jgi:hypothetical protein